MPNPSFERTCAKSRAGRSIQTLNFGTNRYATRSRYQAFQRSTVGQLVSGCADTSYGRCLPRWVGTFILSAAVLPRPRMGNGCDLQRCSCLAYLLLARRDSKPEQRVQQMKVLTEAGLAVLAPRPIGSCDLTCPIECPLNHCNQPLAGPKLASGITPALHKAVACQKIQCQIGR